MKRPDENKKGLECCAGVGQCNECHYSDIWHPMCIIEKSKDALAYIQQLEADNAQQARCIENLTDKLNATNDALPRWISVEERLPRCGQYVLCWYSDIDGDKWHTVGKVMDDGRWAVDIYEIDEPEYYTVTHWMPLPEPPKGE